MSAPLIAIPSAVWPHPPLAREGWTPALACLLAAGTASVLAGPLWSAPLWAVLLLVVRFFRDPSRAIPLQANAVLSPADGRVVRIDRMRDPYTRRDALAVSLFTGLLDVRRSRSPIDATVERVERGAAEPQAGGAGGDRSSALVLRLPGGESISVVQVTGRLGGRVPCAIRPRDRVRRGQRFGFVGLGARIDVYLPLQARACVSVGDTVRATSTIIAEL
jgi:phosphatidylserine decarboxylase